jgi:hypothetical protein
MTRAEVGGREWVDTVLDVAFVACCWGIALTVVAAWAALT